MADGWYGFNVDLPLARQCVEALRQTASQHERPDELGRLELTVTPIGTIDRTVVEQYEELGVDRLVLLPQPDADREHRHAQVSTERIIRNIDSISSMLM